MKGLGVLAGFALALCASPVRGQDPASQPQSRAEDEAAPSEPRPQIRVLRDPYDLASFYRGSAPGSQSPFDFSDRYPIASFYRSGQGIHPQGYSRFWTSGYAGPGAFEGRPGRRIGEQGDLFLLAPTFLAPIGPLTGAFLDER